ncbi:glycosyltransferase family 4 protein [Neobacillus jeddahensis]|uniref:glycosyltransferase family 4 protein n=1 Tax=Neobacillus jeddahensis TaxID=1461580 RepID=UPI0006945BDE|nr:glycosyltransferase family 4 protein [Neobacillus jeddahensis]
MKILYVATISNTVNAFLIPHIKFLIEQGNEVGIACNPVQELNKELLHLECKVHPVSFQRSPFHKENIQAYREIKKIMKSEGYQLVHVHTPVASLITRAACRNIQGVKILYTAHGFHFFKGAPIFNWLIFYSLERLAAKWTDILITMNEEDYHSAKKFNLRRKGPIYIVHGVGLNLHRFKPHSFEEKMRLRKEYEVSSQDFIITYVGELSYRKHQDLLIKAVHQLNEKIKNIKLFLVGDGDQVNAYKKLVQELGLENHVEFLGFRRDIDNIMTISDLAISTSRQEGLPVNIMEAMATGLPVVVTGCRGNSDLVTNGVNGFVVGVEDADACANAIEILYNSKELREEFGKQNLEQIKRYSLENVIKEIKEIYLDMDDFTKNRINMVNNNTGIVKRL